MFKWYIEATEEQEAKAAPFVRFIGILLLALVYMIATR
jgi:hypothetical protein